MDLRPDERTPIPHVGLLRLPSLEQDTGEHADEGDATRAFRAALRGLSPDEAVTLASDATAPLSRGHLAGRVISRAARRLRGKIRRVVAMVAAVVLLLGIGATVLSSHFGVLAFSLGVTPTAAPTMPQPTGAHAGVMAINLPADMPTATATPVSPKATATAITPTATPRPPTATPRPQLPVSQPTNPPVPSGPYSNWTPPPGYTSFAVQDFPGDPWADSFGQCTWWAAYKRPDENFRGMGDAWNWANAARARGYTVTSTPAANGTVVFAPGVQGASNLGHVAHVEKVLTSDWVLVSEMNFYWNGGGWGRVDYRYVHTGSGVWFIH